MRERAGWVNDDGAAHPVRDVHQRRGRAAVVHEDPGSRGAKAEVLRLPLHDVREREVRGDLRGVEVDGMHHAVVVAVRDRHVDHLPLAHVDDWPGGGAVERPRRVLDARRNLDRAHLGDEVDVCDRSACDGRQRCFSATAAAFVGAAPAKLRSGDDVTATLWTSTLLGWARTAVWCADRAWSAPSRLVSAMMNVPAIAAMRSVACLIGDMSGPSGSSDDGQHSTYGGPHLRSPADAPNPLAVNPDAGLRPTPARGRPGSPLPIAPQRRPRRPGRAACGAR
jgi:hypothetical protein